jgi:hypothetical protein
MKVNFVSRVRLGDTIPSLPSCTALIECDESFIRVWFPQSAEGNSFVSNRTKISYRDTLQHLFDR